MVDRPATSAHKNLVETILPVVLQQVLAPDALVAAIRDADLEPCQISARPLPSWLARVVCPRVCLDFASLGPAMLFSGSMPKESYTLVYVTDCEEKGRSFNFAIEHNAGYMGFFPPGGLLDAYTPEGYANATLTVPAGVFEAVVERAFPEIPTSVMARGAGLRIGAAEQARLRGLLAAVTAGIGDAARPLLGAAVRARLESELLETFLTALQSGCGSLARDSGQRTQRRLQRLRQARDYLTEQMHEPVSLAALCGELGMSRRGVELLFKETLGIGPNAFLRHQRLHGVRRALREARGAPGMVKQTALAWGFWHLGHFSRDYRFLFGERPGATLSEAAPQTEDHKTEDRRLET